MNRQEIQDKVKAFMVERLEYEEDKIRPEANMKMDLGMTSLDVYDTIVFIKQTFKIQTDRNAIRNLVTLQDLYDYIESNI